MYEVIVDNEWYFEGTYERCCSVVDSFGADDEFCGSVYMMSEDEFYGRQVH